MNLIQHLVGPREKFSIETRIFHVASLILGFGGMAGVLINLFMEFPDMEVILSGFTSLAATVLFLFSRYYGCTENTKFIFLAVAYFCVILYSFIRPGVQEIVFMMYLSLVAWQLIFSENNQFLWIGVNVISFSVLMSVQFYLPEYQQLSEIHSTGELLDVIFTYLVLSSVLFFMVRSIILNLKRERGEQEQINAELQKLNKEMNQLINTRDKFLSIFSHDLRGPINGIVGLSEQAMEKNEVKDPHHFTNRYMSLINHSAKNITYLLENMLSWVQLQSEQIKPLPEKLAIAGLIKSNLSLYRLAIEQKEIKVKNEVPEDLCVFADPAMIDNIIRNLVSNAIKFSRRKGLISFYAPEPSVNGFASLVVKDEGIGMSSKEVEALLSQPVNTSRAGTENEKGTGLGLLVCREFAIANGGRILIESIKNKGSSFQLDLPYCRSVQNVEKGNIMEQS